MLAIHFIVILLQIYLFVFHAFQPTIKRKVWKISISFVALLIAVDLWRYHYFGYHTINQGDTWLYIFLTAIVGAYITKSRKGAITFVAIYFLNALISMITAVILFSFLSIDIEVALRNPLLSIVGQTSGFFFSLPLVLFMKVVNIKAYFHLISKRELIFWAIGTIMFSYYIFNFLIMWINYHQTLRGQAFGLAGVVGGGFGAVGGLAYMIKSSEAKIVEKKNMAQSITIAQQLDHYKLVQKKDEETRNFRHDIKMQLLAVQGAITTDKIQEASEQVSNLIGGLQDIRSRAGTTTGSDSINANLYFLKREYPTVKCEWEGQIPPNIIMR